MKGEIRLRALPVSAEREIVQDQISLRRSHSDICRPSYASQICGKAQNYSVVRLQRRRVPTARDVKRRPAVVLVGLLPRRGPLHTVVPLSGTPSDHRNRYHCKITLDHPLPHPFSETVWWVKADMVSTVSMDRLDLFRTERDQYGKRKYLTDLRVSDEQFEQIKMTIRHALGLEG